MAGPSWLVDSKRIATKIRCASDACAPQTIKWKSNPTRACPNCNHVIDNSDVIQEWPGLPRGVKFDPSDQELLWHLLAKVGAEGVNSHPFVDAFVPTLDEDDGICYTHPQNLPGVKQDGSVSHFFHRTSKAYNTGSRKRRKIHNNGDGDVRWHKTGKTKPVIMDGIQKGCKKIMVLYLGMAKGQKNEKTNWVMHQYHLGTGEDEKEGEFVVSKIFFQQQLKQGEKNEQEMPLDPTESVTIKVDPVTPKSVTPDPPCSEKRHADLDSRKESSITNKETVVQGEAFVKTGPLQNDRQGHADDGSKQESTIACEEPIVQAGAFAETGHLVNDVQPEYGEKVDDNENQAMEETKWWEGESQYLLDSQQLVEGLSLCDELLQSQTSCEGDDESKKDRPRLSDYTRIGAEDLKRDLEDCQKLTHFDHADHTNIDCQKSLHFDHIDHINIERDTPPEFRLSQLEFGSQDSFPIWTGSKETD